MLPVTVALPLAVNVVAAIVPLSVRPAVVVVPVTPNVPPTVVLPVTVALPLAVNVTIDVVPVEVIPVNPVAFVPLNTASRFDIVVSELTLVVDLNVAMSEALSYVESLSVSINVAI